MHKDKATSISKEAVNVKVNLSWRLTNLQALEADLSSFLAMVSLLFASVLGLAYLFIAPILGPTYFLCYTTHTIRDSSLFKC
jgi:hypothetical protein